MFEFQGQINVLCVGYSAHHNYVILQVISLVAAVLDFGTVHKYKEICYTDNIYSKGRLFILCRMPMF